MRELEKRAAAELGLFEPILMETAGAGAARALLQRWQSPRGKVLILAGKGNNGADGGVMARHLSCEGLAARVLYLCDCELQQSQARIVRQASIRLGLAGERGSELQELRQALAGLGESDVLVDALLGTGSTGPLRQDLAQWIEFANTATKPLRMALDIPSGLDPDTGQGLGCVFRADFTATFLAPKPGLSGDVGRAHAGEVEVISLGLPWTW